MFFNSNHSFSPFLSFRQPKNLILVAGIGGMTHNVCISANIRYFKTKALFLIRSFLMYKSKISCPLQQRKYNSGQRQIIQGLIIFNKSFTSLVFSQQSLYDIVLCTNNTNLRKLTMIELLVRIPILEGLKNLNTNGVNINYKAS